MPGAAALACYVFAQETFPLNGIYDVRPNQFAFTNATIVVNADQTITGGTLLIKDRKIEARWQGCNGHPERLCGYRPEREIYLPIT